MLTELNTEYRATISAAQRKHISKLLSSAKAGALAAFKDAVIDGRTFDTITTTVCASMVSDLFLDHVSRLKSQIEDTFPLSFSPSSSSRVKSSEDEGDARGSGVESDVLVVPLQIAEALMQSVARNAANIISDNT